MYRDAETALLRHRSAMQQRAFGAAVGLAEDRNVEAAALHGEDADDVEGAWDSVFEMGRTPAVNEAEEARKRHEKDAALMKEQIGKLRTW